jgi:hypothetical protein
MAAHYGTAVLPTRPRRPRDKAKVEAAVLVVERWILARLRHRRFYSLAELNAAISELLRQLDEERPIRRLGVTRRQLLEELDRPALKPVPGEPYVFAEWRVRRVGIDYHIEVERHFYSVPYRFARSEVEVRLTSRTVEIFARGERIEFAVRPSAVANLSRAETKHAVTQGIRRKGRGTTTGSPVPPGQWMPRTAELPRNNCGPIESPIANCFTRRPQFGHGVALVFFASVTNAQSGACLSIVDLQTRRHANNA